MAPAVNNLDLVNPLLRTYIFYMSVLSLKMLLVTVLTVFHRFRTGHMASSEDKVFYKNGKTSQQPDVERVRRAHRNDLENIPIFMVISLLYILTNPNVVIASMLFRVYTVARIIHTLAYAFLANHSYRGAAWATGFIITIYMSATLVMSFMDYK